MTDLTLNHTGDVHEWFVAAQADAESEEAGFYYFIDHPDRYESWLGIDSLPKLDHRSAELRRRYYDGPDSILARYLKPPFDMAGWRIDVANMTGRLGPIDLNQDVARTARATVDTVDDELAARREMARRRTLLRCVTRRSGRRLARRHELRRPDPSDRVVARRVHRTRSLHAGTGPGTARRRPDGGGDGRGRGPPRHGRSRWAR